MGILSSMRVKFSFGEKSSTVKASKCPATRLSNVPVTSCEDAASTGSSDSSKKNDYNLNNNCLETVTNNNQITISESTRTVHYVKNLISNDKDSIVLDPSAAVLENKNSIIVDNNQTDVSGNCVFAENKTCTEFAREEETEAPAVIVRSRDDSALSRTQEVRTDVTGDILQRMLKATLKQGNAAPTQDLVLQASRPEKDQTLGYRRMAQLVLCCPHLRELSLHGLNLHAKHGMKPLRMSNFPEGLECLSLCDSLIKPTTFFAGVPSSHLKNLRVLDLSRISSVGDGGRSDFCLPKLVSLRELYLEGAFDNRDEFSLASLLVSFPKLEVLDIESSKLKQENLAQIAVLVPGLRELYVGQTGLRDAAIMQLLDSLEEGKGSLDQLGVICLTETGVSDVGLQYLLGACPSLRLVSCSTSTVRAGVARALEYACPFLKIRRVEMTSIFAAIGDRCCGHSPATQREHQLRGARRTPTEEGDGLA